MILFIIKRTHDYDGDQVISNGLRNSAQFVVDLLMHEGIKARLVDVIDANGIDAAVTRYRPERVVIEALWVTPTKLDELAAIHHGVKWTVRAHSELPFLAQEGCAVEWLAAYEKLPHVEVAFNSGQTVEDLAGLIFSIWLPNYYPLSRPRAERPTPHGELRVGCFGAIRPLKNQLIQAVAAIQWAKRKKRPLVFHMNGGRVEQNGSNNLKNIEALFADMEETLVMHEWLARPEFLELVAEMDVCMQVSLSESFNITAADAVGMGVPVVGSASVPWLTRRSQADPGSAASIVDALGRADRITVFMNHQSLEDYLAAARKKWLQWVEA
jgi:hypothetical protein